jgi:hypothetical protein
VVDFQVIGSCHHEKGVLKITLSVVSAHHLDVAASSQLLQ